MKIFSIEEFFCLEKKRALLSKQRNYKELIKTYNKSFPKIKNSNTGSFWDKLNIIDVLQEEQNPMAYYRIKFVCSLISKGSKVLDIGFGSGNLEHELYKRFVNKIIVYGLDISKNSVIKASNRFKEWIFKSGNIINLNFSKNFFDYVVALEVLEHIEPYLLFKALNEIKKVLKKDGLFILSVPLNENLQEMLRAGNNPNAHLRKYEPELIETELKIAGFEIVKRKFLFAFHKNFLLKSFVVKYLLIGVKKPNNIILVARKK